MSRSAAAALAALALWLAAPAARADKAVLVDKIVAIVGEVTILRSDVIASSRPFYGKLGAGAADRAKLDEIHREVLARMIDDVIVAREAQRLGVDIRDAEVDQAKEWIAKQNGMTRAQLDAEVQKQGLGKEEYDAELRRQLMSEKWVAIRVRPRIRRPLPAADKPDEQKAFMQEIEAERKKAIAELRKGAYVEVRW